MKAKAGWIKNREFVLEANGLEFMAEGGHDEKAPSPEDYFLAGLAAGVADWVGEILKSNAELTGLSVEATSYGPDSQYLNGHFNVAVTLPEGLSESLQRAAHKAAETSLEAHALMKATPVKFEYHVLEVKEDHLWNSIS